MDDYIKCLKDFIVDEISRLKVKEQVYVEIYNRNYDEYIVKEKEILYQIEQIKKTKKFAGREYKRKIKIFKFLSIILSSLSVGMICLILSSLNINIYLAYLVSSFFVFVLCYL